MKLSAIGITNLSGKAGGSIFSRNRGGQYVKNFAVPSNPNTMAQQAKRSVFGSLSASWRNLASSARQDWNSIAKFYPKKNTFGDTIVLSGFGIFQSLNLNLSLVNIAPLTFPSMPLGTSHLGSISTIATLDALTNSFNLTPTGVLLGDSIPNTLFLVSASFGRAQAGLLPQNQLRNISVMTEADLLSGSDIRLDFLGVFPTPALNDWVELTFTPINGTTGERSAAFLSQVKVVAA